MSLLKLSPAEFCEATDACKEGRDWALTQPTMADVWDNCPRAEWLLWITEKLNRRPDDRTLRLFAVWCARNTPLVGGRKTGNLLTDPRSLAALEVAERYAHGNATDNELAAAWYAASDAARAAALATARYAASDAARTAALATAWYAARDAARAAWYAASAAASDEERAAALATAWYAAWYAQVAYFRTMVTNPFQKEAKPCGCTNGIIRAVGRDNEEIIEDCPHCSARKEAQP